MRRRSTQPHLAKILLKGSTRLSPIIVKCVTHVSELMTLFRDAALVTDVSSVFPMEGVEI